LLLRSFPSHFFLFSYLLCLVVNQPCNMFLLGYSLLWITLFIPPAICLGTFEEENKRSRTSTDKFQHEQGNTSKFSNNDWTEGQGEDQSGGDNQSGPIKDLAADRSKPSATYGLRKKMQRSMTSTSAMHVIKKQIRQRSLDKTSGPKSKDKKKKSGKIPPHYVSNGKYNMKMKPSIHTIVACITAVMVVFHIIICLSVWQQCKTHNRPQVLAAPLPLGGVAPRSRPRQNGEQSFSDLVEEPPLIGEVPLPPEYKEGEDPKPPSYDNIIAPSPNSDHTRAV